MVRVAACKVGPLELRAYYFQEGPTYHRGSVNDILPGATRLHLLDLPIVHFIC